MSTEVDFDPVQLIVNCQTGKVHVGYNVLLTTPDWEGSVGGADVEVFDERIEEAAKNLTEAVISHLRERVGLSTADNLSDGPPARDEEDPL